jgi:hypothetical protein
MAVGRGSWRRSGQARQTAITTIAGNARSASGSSQEPHDARGQPKFAEREEAESTSVMRQRYQIAATRPASSAPPGCPAPADERRHEYYHDESNGKRACAEVRPRCEGAASAPQGPLSSTRAPIAESRTPGAPSPLGPSDPPTAGAQRHGMRPQRPRTAVRADETPLSRAPHPGTPTPGSRYPPQSRTESVVTAHPRAVVARSSGTTRALAHAGMFGRVAAPRGRGLCH